MESNTNLKVAHAAPMTTTARFAVDRHIALITADRAEVPESVGDGTSFAVRRGCRWGTERFASLCPCS
jgi:hypothetical protein